MHSSMPLPFDVAVLGAGPGPASHLAALADLPEGVRRATRLQDLPDDARVRPVPVLMTSKDTQP
jgi:hypothetical protein